MTLEEKQEELKILEKKLNSPSKEQLRACDELISDCVKKIFIANVIEGRKREFTIYPDLEKYLNYQMLRDIDKGVYDDHEWTENELIERYLS